MRGKTIDHSVTLLRRDVYQQHHSDDMYCSSMCFYKLIFASEIVHAKRLSSNMCIDAEARTYALFEQARTLGKVNGYYWN